MHRHAIRLLALAGVLGTAGCEDVVPPPRSPGYALEDPQNGLTYRWPRNLLPVRYWVAGDAGLVRGFVGDGIRRWTASFQYGEYRGIIVADSADADVLVYVIPGTPPNVPLTNDPPVVGACGGRTRYDLADNEDRLLRPFRIFVEWDDRFPDADIVNCLERVTVHEIGHTIGLFAHSANDLDLMYPTPRVREPSPGDRATAEILYHSATTIAAPTTD